VPSGVWPFRTPPSLDLLWVLSAFLAGQLDFILLGYALALGFFGVVATFIRRERAGPFPWVWLALFAFTHGATELAQLAEEALGLPEPLHAARTVTAALSFAALAEFGRRSLATTWPSRVPGPWIHLALLALVGLVSRGDLFESRTAFRYVFGVCGGLASAYALFRARGSRGQPTRPLGWAGLLLSAHALTTGISVAPGRYFPSSVLNATTFFATTGVPIELARGLIISALALALFAYHLRARRAEHPGLPDDRVPQIGILVVLAAMVSGGWLATQSLGRMEEREFRAGLASQAATAAAALEAVSLRAPPAPDRPRPAAGLERLRERLSIIRAESPHLMRVYVLELRDDLVVTVADSALTDSRRALAPVPRFFLPQEALDAVFATGRPSITGPTLGRLTALAAIRSLEGAKAVGALGVEVDAARLVRVVTRGRLTGIVLTLGLVHLLMAFSYFRQRTWEADRIIELSERRLRDAQSIAHVGSWSIDFSSGRMSWSQEMFAIVGRDPSLPPPSSEEFEDCFLPEDAERRREALARARIDGKPYEVSLRLRRADGEIRHLVSLVWPERDDTGRVARVMGTTTDVTEKVRSQDAVRAEKERAQQYLDVAGVMIVVIDADERIALVNTKACDVLGYDRNELVGRNWFDAVVQERERPRTRAAFVAVLSGRMDLAATFENRVVTRGGVERLIAWNNAVIRDASGKALASLSSGEDITERRRAEDSVMELNAMLELRVIERTAEIERALAQLQVESAERTKAEESLRRRQQERLSAAEALNSVSKVLTDVTLDYEAALEALAHHLAAMEGDACLVSLLSDDAKWLYPVAFHHVDPAKAEAGRTLLASNPFRLGHGLASEDVVERGQARVVPSLTRAELDDLMRREHEPLLATFDPTSLAVAPMRAHGRVMGTLALLRDGSGAALGDDQKALLQATADRAALTLTTSRLYAKNLAQAETLRQTNLQLQEKVAERTEALEQANAKLEQLATHDGLTGLLNRRHLDDVLARECRRSQRRGEALAVLMCDVDFFKRFNDRYGHGAGDECLKRIAACLQSVFRRASDFAARYGGEEFVVVAAETEPAHLPAMAERLRGEMAALGIPHEASDAAPVVTISIGVVSAISGADRDPAWFLAQADAALYRAKATGRNRAETVLLAGAPDVGKT
jgi:diguanylate cyclase (GGDEF)-like protein/PAS domain S-box-containing protein